MALNYSRLGGNNSNFHSMIQRFGVVTVMNALVYEGPSQDTLESWKSMQANAIINSLTAQTPLTRLDTLKIANVPQEGPSKTVTGGQYSNPLIKFGKTARLEMQDALGNAAALDALTGTVSEASAKLTDRIDYEQVDVLHVTEDFQGAKTIVGDSFFIEQKTGAQVQVKIIFYQFLPDSLFNLTQDAEGDATVFDMNGDLLTTDIAIKDFSGTPRTHGVFYSIIDAELNDANAIAVTKNGEGKIVVAGTYTSLKLDGVTITSGAGNWPAAGSAALLQAFDESDNVIFEQVLIG